MILKTNVKSSLFNRKSKALLLNAPQTCFIEKFADLAEWEQSQLLSLVKLIADKMNANKLDATRLLKLSAMSASSINSADAPKG